MCRHLDRALGDFSEEVIVEKLFSKQASVSPTGTAWGRPGPGRRRALPGRAAAAGADRGLHRRALLPQARRRGPTASTCFRARPSPYRGYFHGNDERIDMESLVLTSALRAIRRESFSLPSGSSRKFSKKFRSASTSYGDDLLRFHPHLHCLVSDGLFLPDGSFLPLTHTLMSSGGKTFAVGSLNPVKIRCVTEAVAGFSPDARVVPASVDSLVPTQPLGDKQIYDGALNRARHVLESVADYGVGVEGGVSDSQDGMWAFAWVVIVDRQGQVGRGKTGHFLLPEGVARLVREEGLELGDADDRFFIQTNSKQKEGAIGILSDGAITRFDLYRQGMIFALLPFIHPEYYG